MAAAIGKPLTGRKVALIFVGAFATIIGANLALVYAAVGSFPGLEVRNTYVASQSFDADRAAQDALGWTATTGYDGAAVTVTMTGPDGQPAAIAEMTATIGRATTAAADMNLPFTQAASPYSAPALLAPGKWEVRINAISADGTKFHRRLPIIVKTGG
jgi:nitrogen fixation protein FixH